MYLKVEKISDTNTADNDEIFLFEIFYNMHGCEKLLLCNIY